MKNYVIFVEGPTDELFIKKLFCEKLSLLRVEDIFVNYANMEKKKIKNYINSINSISNYDYIFLADQDGNSKKIDKLLRTYSFLDRTKIFVSVYEIESWIYSGISDKIFKKYKIKSLNVNTSLVTKEMFDRLIPKSLNKLEFIAYILDDYNIDAAIIYNESLKMFYDYLNKKKQAKDCF